jgi:methionyl-tRNA formyltransferase
VAPRAVVFAYHDVGARCLQVLLDAGVEVALVVTHRDDPGEHIWFASVSDFSREKNIRTLKDPELKTVENELREIAPDFIFSFYYRRMLPIFLLRMAKRGAYNMHGSLLPRYRGRAPVNWAILKGETETGATLHEMLEKPDAGRIVDQQAVPIGPDELAVEVFRKVTDAAETVLRRSVAKLIDGTAKLREQDLSAGSYYGGRKPEDGRIDWSRSAREIHNLVRAVAPPYPGAFAEGMRINKTALTGKAHSRKMLGPYQDAGEWFAACGDGKVLRLLEIEKK